MKMVDKIDIFNNFTPPSATGEIKRKRASHRFSENRNFVKERLASSSDLVEDSEAVKPGLASSLPALNPFLGLQEFDLTLEKKPEKRKLMREAKTLLEYLDEIRLGILDENLSLKKLQIMKNFLENNQGKFASDEEQNLYNEISLRLQVEITKIEYLNNDK